MIKLELNGELINWTEPIEYKYNGGYGLLIIDINHRVWFVTDWIEGDSMDYTEIEKILK